MRRRLTPAQFVRRSSIERAMRVFFLLFVLAFSAVFGASLPSPAPSAFKFDPIDVAQKKSVLRAGRLWARVFLNDIGQHKQPNFVGRH
uniref:Uncharacterized protein n=1 Tax=Plectus sambesii TaxID=2011161 RepID=A0A914VDT5_9BILA